MSNEPKPTIPANIHRAAVDAALELANRRTLFKLTVAEEAQIIAERVYRSFNPTLKDRVEELKKTLHDINK